jgi:hypothetical protein
MNQELIKLFPKAAGMKVNLHSDLSEKVLAIARDYNYAPAEVISIGVALVNVLLREKSLGNRVVVVSPEGDKVSEFREPEPKAIYEMAKAYLESVCPGLPNASVSLVVARLERERDVEVR